MSRRKKTTEIDMVLRDARWEVSCAESHMDLARQMLATWEPMLAKLKAGTLEAELVANIATAAKAMEVGQARIDSALRIIAQHDKRANTEAQR